MKIKIIVSILFIITLNCFGQENYEYKPSKVMIGIEQDILPYVFNGYIITGWIGRDYFRYRISYAEAKSPKFILSDDIESDKVEAFGISFEYFFKENFNGLWLGPGVGYWTNYIQTTQNETLNNESLIFTFGGGYNYPITSWLYISPWIATHFRVSGKDGISSANAITYKPAILTPELSIKLGIKLPAEKK